MESEEPKLPAVRSIAWLGACVQLAMAGPEELEQKGEGLDDGATNESHKRIPKCNRLAPCSELLVECSEVPLKFLANRELNLYGNHLARA